MVTFLKSGYYYLKFRENRLVLFESFYRESDNQMRVEAGWHLWRLSRPKEDHQVFQGLNQSGFRGEADKYIRGYGHVTSVKQCHTMGVRRFKGDIQRGKKMMRGGGRPKL